MTWVLSMLANQAAAGPEQSRRPGYAPPYSYGERHEPAMSPLFEGPERTLGDAGVYSPVSPTGYSPAPQRPTGSTPIGVAPVAGKQRPKNSSSRPGPKVALRRSTSDLRQPAPDRSQQQISKSQSVDALTPLRQAHAQSQARGASYSPSTALQQQQRMYAPVSLPPPPPNRSSPASLQPQPQPHGNSFLQLEPLLPSAEEAERLRREVERLETEKGAGVRQLQAALEQVRWLQLQVDRAQGRGGRLGKGASES
eukprot:tig00020675_g12604.t1